MELWCMEVKKWKNSYENLFSKDIIYEDSIIDCICEAYDLVITDCLKDDNEITIALDERASLRGYLV